MVSFQAPLSSSKSISYQLDNSSKKRKLEEPHIDQGINPEKRSNPESTKSFFEIELHLETPLPLEWQRCLDIQSGQIHFYNTRTHKRTSRDPRRSPESPSPDHMSLDLELNLPSESQGKNNHIKKQNSDHSPSNIRGLGDLFRDSSTVFNYNKNSGGEGGGLTQQQRPPWLAFERDQQEMVATVCSKCHMLVMLCMSSPACPNCKFMHPPDQSPPKLFNQRFSLLW